MNNIYLNCSNEQREVIIKMAKENGVIINSAVFDNNPSYPNLVWLVQEKMIASAAPFKSPIKMERSFEKWVNELNQYSQVNANSLFIKLLSLKCQGYDLSKLQLNFTSGNQTFTLDRLDNNNEGLLLGFLKELENVK